MQERKRNMVKRKIFFIRMAVLLALITVVVLYAQTVFAQNTYVISDGGRILVHTSSTLDPATVLTEAGLALGADDTYTTQTANGVSEITVQRSELVRINNCGRNLAVPASEGTVASLLNNLNIQVDGNTEVSVPMEMEVYGGLEITVSRTVRQEQTYTTNIPYSTTYCYDNSIPRGTEVVITQGQDGQMLCTATVVYVDYEETGRTVTQQTVVRQPVDQVIAIGTADEPLPPEKPADSVRIEDGYIYLPTGEVLSYTDTMQVLATAYSHLDAGCDFITATGTTVHIGTVAVDPRVIPLGTRMFIVTNDGEYVYGISTAEDTGGAIKKARVDLYFPTYEQCMEFGRRNATIYFLG